MQKLNIEASREDEQVFDDIEFAKLLNPYINQGFETYFDRVVGGKVNAQYIIKDLKKIISIQNATKYIKFKNDIYIKFRDDIMRLFGLNGEKRICFKCDKGKEMKHDRDDFIECLAELIIRKINENKNMKTKNIEIKSDIEKEIIVKNNNFINEVAKTISDRMLKEWKFGEGVANAYLQHQYTFGDLSNSFQKQTDRDGEILVEYPIGIKFKLKTREDFDKHVLNIVMNNLSKVNRSVYDLVNYPRGVQHTEQIADISIEDKKTLHNIFVSVVDHFIKIGNDLNLKSLKKQILEFIKNNKIIDTTLDRFFKDVNFKEQKITYGLLDGSGFYTFGFDFFVDKIEQEVVSKIEEKKKKDAEAKVGKRGLNGFGNTEIVNFDPAVLKSINKSIEKMSQAELEAQVEYLYHKLNSNETIDGLVQEIVRKGHKTGQTYGNMFLSQNSPLKEIKSDLENIFSKLNGVAEIRVWGGVGYKFKYYSSANEILNEKVEVVSERVHEKLLSRKERFFAWLRNIRDDQNRFQSPENFAVVQRHFESKRWSFEDKFAVFGGVAIGGSMLTVMALAYAKQNGIDISIINEYLGMARENPEIIKAVINSHIPVAEKINLPKITDISFQPVIEVVNSMKETIFEIPSNIKFPTDLPSFETMKPIANEAKTIVPNLPFTLGELSSDLINIVKVSEVVPEAVKSTSEYLSKVYEIKNPKDQYISMIDFFKNYCDANSISGNVDKASRNFAMNIFERFPNEFTGKMSISEILQKASKLYMEVEGKTFNLLDRSLYWATK